MGPLPYGGERRSQRAIENAQNLKRIQNERRRQDIEFSRWDSERVTNRAPAHVIWYAHRVLHRATGGFAFRNRVGEGQNGSIFHGHLRDDGYEEVAVKKFKSTSADPMEKVLAEVSVHRLLSKHAQPDVRHLKGVSYDPKEPLLVYEYMPRGSLRQHLQGKKGDYMISNAGARLAVAIDVANALCELHYNCPFPVFHRDVKSSNVLLDEDYRGKLADLGLAVVVRQDADLQSPVALGAFGYKDPLYEQTGTLNDKTDVYSFGVLLMELATHLPAWDPARPVSLLSHIVLERVRRGLIDPLLQPGKFFGGAKLVKELIHIAVQCCSLDMASRPSIDMVANSLIKLEQRMMEELVASKGVKSVTSSRRVENSDTQGKTDENCKHVFYRGKWVVPKKTIDFSVEDYDESI